MCNFNSRYKNYITRNSVVFQLRIPQCKRLRYVLSIHVNRNPRWLITFITVLYCISNSLLRAASWSAVKIKFQNVLRSDRLKCTIKSKTKFFKRYVSKYLDHPKFSSQFTVLLMTYSRRYLYNFSYNGKLWFSVLIKLNKHQILLNLPFYINT